MSTIMEAIVHEIAVMGDLVAEHLPVSVIRRRMHSTVKSRLTVGVIHESVGFETVSEMNVHQYFPRNHEISVTVELLD